MGGRAHFALVMNIDAGDALIGVFLCDTADDVLLVTRLGEAIRFAQDEVRVMGLAAAGGPAMKVSDGDQMAGGGLCKNGYEAVIPTTQGYGLRSQWKSSPARNVMAAARGHETQP